MSRRPVQAPHDISPAQEWLADHHNLPGINREALAETAAKLANRVVAGNLQRIGLCGAPGTGKSTLAGLLRHLLERRGLPCHVLSVDDYYLPLKERIERAEQVHPLLRQRGVPGTHDLGLLVSDFDCLHRGDPRRATLPRFDKSSDDRAETGQNPPRRRPAVVVVEGWFVGSPAAEAITANEFLQRHDDDGRWRRYVVDQWRTFDRMLTPRLQECWFLRDPGWSQVLEWRWQQEQRLARPRLGSLREVRDFLQTFQPVYELIRSHMPGRADVLLELDTDHVPRLGE